jgi:hypothetical protein
MMSIYDDSSTRRHRAQVVNNDDEYARDWHRITGERFSLESYATRIHQADFARVETARCAALARTGHFCEEYRVLDLHGRYVWVHGESRYCNGRWVGGVKIIQRDDRPHLCAREGCFCRVIFGGFQ